MGGVRVIIHLLNAETDAQVWEATCDGEVKNLFGLAVVLQGAAHSGLRAFLLFTGT
jgi:TolB-like protein